MNMRRGSGKVFNKEEWKNEYAQELINEWLDGDKESYVIEIVTKQQKTSIPEIEIVPKKTAGAQKKTGSQKNTIRAEKNRGIVE
jgi:hypothetical protein